MRKVVQTLNVFMTNTVSIPTGVSGVSGTSIGYTTDDNAPSFLLGDEYTLRWTKKSDDSIIYLKANEHVSFKLGARIYLEQTEGLPQLPHT